MFLKLIRLIYDRENHFPYVLDDIHFSLPPFPLPHIAYHRTEIIARHGEQLFAAAHHHATDKGMEGDTGITVAEALLQDIQDATHQKYAVPD